MGGNDAENSLPM